MSLSSFAVVGNTKARHAGHQRPAATPGERPSIRCRNNLPLSITHYELRAEPSRSNWNLSSGMPDLTGERYLFSFILIFLIICCSFFYVFERWCAHGRSSARAAWSEMTVGRRAPSSDVQSTANMVSPRTLHVDGVMRRNGSIHRADAGISTSTTTEWRRRHPPPSPPSSFSGSG